MRILCYGDGVETFSRLNKENILPSNILYGTAELKQKGYDVDYIQLSKKGGVNGILTDVRNIYNTKHDILFTPYIRSKSIYGLLILKWFGLYRKPILGVLHKTPDHPNWLLKRIFRTLSHTFFHSEKNRQECVSLGCTRKERSSVINWGVQLDYYDRLPVGEPTRFISTGMENRDFATLMKAFAETNEQLSVYIPEKKKDAEELKPFREQKYENIRLNFVHQTDDTIRELATIAKGSFAFVIPVQKDALYYCVGHTSMVEALAMGKPMIVVKNPYHPIDVEREKVGLTYEAGNAESLEEAIAWLAAHPEEAEAMGKRARQLAETTYNIEHCAEQIEAVIKSL